MPASLNTDVEILKEDRDLVPLVESPKLSLRDGIANLTKATIGAGILFLPLSVSQAGLFPGIFLIAFAGLMMTYSLHFLARCSAAGKNDISSLAKDLFGRPGEITTSIFQFVFLLTPLTVYVKLIGEFLMNFIRFFVPALLDSAFVNAKTISLACSLFFIFPLCCLRDLSKLSFISILGLTCAAYISGLVVIDFFVDLAKGALGNPTIDPAVFGTSILSAFSAIVLSFVNQPSIGPILASLHDPTPKRRFILIIVTQLTVLSFYILTALCGYLHFGAAINSAGFENILFGKKDDIFYVLGGLFTFILLLMTYPVIHFPARLTLNYIILLITDRFMPKASDKIRGNHMIFILEGVFLVVITTLMAVLFNKVTDILSVFVPVGGSYIGFLFPSAAFLKMRQTLNASRLEICMAIACCCLGFLVLLIGTPVAIWGLLK